MYLKKIFMDEKGSLSYLIGCPETKKACVVDPRKTGVHEYVEIAEKFHMKITHIFDTSSSANPLNGNTELETRTGAHVYYLRNREDIFNHFIIEEGDTFDFGQARIEIINSPRHDPYVNSIRVTDTFDVDSPWMILKKESLFIGNLEKSEEGGAKLSEEIFSFLSCIEDTDKKTASDSSDFNRYSDYGKNPEYAVPSMG